MKIHLELDPRQWAWPGVVKQYLGAGAKNIVDDGQSYPKTAKPLPKAPEAPIAAKAQPASWPQPSSENVTSSGTIPEPEEPDATDPLHLAAYYQATSGETSEMATAATPAATAATAAAVPAVPAAAAKTSAWKSILDHVETYFNLGLSVVIEYTPPAELLAEELFPEYTGLEQAARDSVVEVATLLRNTVLTIQQKYSDAAKSDETNAAKLADALALAAAPALTILGIAGVKADVTRITNIVQQVVRILHLIPAPSTTAAVKTAA